MSAPLPPPPTALPINAPAAAPPAMAPRLRARVEPATIGSVLAVTACSRPLTEIDFTARDNDARLRFWAGCTAFTTPDTVLPLGITTVLPTMTFSFTSPVQLSPTWALSVEIAVLTDTSIGVPAASVTPDSRAGADEGEVFDGVWCRVEVLVLGCDSVAAGAGGVCSLF